MKNILLLLTVFSIGCATIMTPGPDRINVNTSPDGAKVIVNGMPVGRTPMVITPRRDEDLDIRIQLDGYEPVVINRSKEFNNWMFGNILLGGIVGIVVDIAAKNNYKHSGDPVYVELTAMKMDGNNLAETTKVPLTRSPASAE